MEDYEKQKSLHPRAKNVRATGSDSDREQGRSVSADVVNCKRMHLVS